MSANRPKCGHYFSPLSGRSVVLRYNFQKPRSRSIIGLGGLLLMGGESIEVDQPWIVRQGAALGTARYHESALGFARGGRLGNPHAGAAARPAATFLVTRPAHRPAPCAPHHSPAKARIERINQLMSIL